MMTTKRAPKPKAAAEPETPTVTVQVVEPFAVYFDGQQRAGTLHDVPADTAAHWQRHRLGHHQRAADQRNDLTIGTRAGASNPDKQGRHGQGPAMTRTPIAELAPAPPPAAITRHHPLTARRAARPIPPRPGLRYAAPTRGRGEVPPTGQPTPQHPAKKVLYGSPNFAGSWQTWP